MVAAVAKPQHTIPRKTYIPIGCLVAVHMYPVEKTQAGLIMPDGTQNPLATSRCLVIAIGPEVKQIKEGDEVLCFNPASGVIHDGQTTGLIREDHIAGIIMKKESRADEPALHGAPDR